MTARIRLGWETRLDQLTVAVNTVVIGVGLVLVGALADWSGWLTIPMIVVGSLLCLIAAVRLQGWRTLVWTRNLRADGEGITDDTKKGAGFSVSWSELAALGMIEEDGHTTRFGLIVVFFPNSEQFAEQHRGARFTPLPGSTALMARIPRRDGVLAAIRDAAPAGWQTSSASWQALLTAPGVAPETIPAPPVATPSVVVDAGTRVARQSLSGGGFAAFLGIVAMIAAFDDNGTSAGMRAVFALVGSPFLLLGLTTALSVPVLLRKRHILIDQRAFTWDDPAENSFTVPWSELSGVAVESTVVRNWKTEGRSSVRVVLRTRKSNFAAQHKEILKFAAGENGRRYVVPLGDQPAAGQAVAEAVRRFAPDVWQGATDRPGRFGIT